jgi:protein subunit release factor B
MRFGLPKKRQFDEERTNAEIRGLKKQLENEKLIETKSRLQQEVSMKRKARSPLFQLGQKIQSFQTKPVQKVKTSRKAKKDLFEDFFK